MEFLKRPTAEEAVALNEWAEWVVALGYDGFQEAKSSLPGWSNQLMRFYMLPHSPLHDKFDEVIVKPDREASFSLEEGRIRGLIKSGIRSFISDKHLDAYQSSKVKYHLVRRFTIKNHLTDRKDEVLQVGIPYEVNGKPEFFGSVLVYKSKAPKVFQWCLEKYPWFQGDAEFSFLSN